MLRLDDCIVAGWAAQRNVKALFTTRAGGVSTGDLASLNLGRSVGDDPAAVAENRRRVETLLGYPPRWMSQVHGTTVAHLDQIPITTPIEADAAVAWRPHTVCTAMVADCLPVVFTDRAGTVVAAAHAGWRGLAGGVLEATIASMRVTPQEILAHMGPAIGPNQFEVGEDVRDAFVGKHANASAAFEPVETSGPPKYLADIFALARMRMIAAGMTPSNITGGGLCTVTDETRFFSYRRSTKLGGQSGRMAGLIWLD